MNLRLKQIRKHFNKTQKEFGESLGVSRDTFASYESGRVDPSKTFIQLMCSTYNINIEWLVTGKGDMRAEPKQSFLEELSGEYGLSFTAQKIIESYLNAGDEQRAKMDLFLNNIADSLSTTQGESASSSVIDRAIELLGRQTPPTVRIIREDEIDAEVEAYRRELLEEAKGAVKSSVFPLAKDA